ncbi:2',3'-cyclic-nucleotide 2'-phosphodiesterase (5'-nucleotidase family) [Anoxybacillus tengchongensis]|uniref:2',3'-cyclic-nucleotide 2'-phosphodiesterase (5'-nucleotidase family) n=1 Tax=Anoxybacillus tengchongensis TaxID=576944 RepID=A0A7W9YPK2_9BACL|nr:5'-nucleotidase C-terminal domain-containing protein [Anoxybacillus tengchongensis]MBB6176005.1 2',3'-cyclic-nucleotide 2'-phosphodiesterase (5'-nucleotidase family) [Anoxybacillus tengchongensis]
MYKMKKWLMFACMFAVAFVLQPQASEASEHVTRGEFVQQLITTLGVDIKSEVKELPFTDVDPQLAPYVEAAIRLGIASGKTETTFAPNEKITREQAYVFLIRSLQLRHHYATNVFKLYEDEKSIKPWAQQSLAAALHLGLLQGYSDKTIRPQEWLTSEQIKTILKRYETNIEKITFIHTNDTHGRVIANTQNGEMGFAKIAKIAQDARQKNKQTLLVDLGDTFHGTTYVNLNNGQTVVDLMNAMKYDAMVPGNHDFNYGQNRLLELKQAVQFPVVSGNIYKNGQPFLPAYTIKQVGKKKIALVGLTATDTAVKTNPAGIVGITFADEEATLKQLVDELKGKVDHIVVLSHAGLQTDEKLANNVSGVDVILGGHSHDTIEAPKKFKYAYVSQAFEYGKALGQTNLLFYKGKLIGVNGFLYRDSATKQEDATVRAIVDTYKNNIDATLQQVIATIDVNLDGERANVRTKETNLGNLVADAMRQALQTDVALTNGGGIRASIPKGNVTRNHILTTLPFANTLVKVSMSGADLKKALEHGVRLYPEQNGGFPHVSGIRFTFDATKPAGSRVTSVQINGQPLDEAKTYTVATNDFIAKGGDGYDMFKTNKLEFDSGELLSTVVINYLQSQKPISAVEGRITVANQ